jgi:hypothetical protein
MRRGHACPACIYVDACILHMCVLRVSMVCPACINEDLHSYTCILHICVLSVSMVCPACIYVDTHVHPTHVGNGVRERERAQQISKQKLLILDFSPRDSPDPAFGYSLHVSLQAGLHAPPPYPFPDPTLVCVCAPPPPPPQRHRNTNMCHANWYASYSHSSCVCVCVCVCVL